MVEVTDIMFSADSILASVTVTQVYWVMVAGGVIGILAMRFAAGFFASIMHTFPRLEDAAFLLIAAAGLRIFVEGLASIQIPDPAFYALLVACLGYGFTKRTDGKISV
jgi:predicted tellurium resistance membrane protein TerC